jgi:hypothetical protein
VVIGEFGSSVLWWVTTSAALLVFRSYSLTLRHAAGGGHLISGNTNRALTLIPPSRVGECLRKNSRFDGTQRTVQCLNEAFLPSRAVVPRHSFASLWPRISQIIKRVRPCTDRSQPQERPLVEGRLPRTERSTHERLKIPYFPISTIRPELKEQLFTLGCASLMAAVFVCQAL